MTENETPLDIAVSLLPNANILIWLMIAVIVIIFLGILLWLWWDTL